MSVTLDNFYFILTWDSKIFFLSAITTITSKKCSKCCPKLQGKFSFLSRFAVVAFLLHATELFFMPGILNVHICNIDSKNTRKNCQGKHPFSLFNNVIICMTVTTKTRPRNHQTMTIWIFQENLPRHLEASDFNDCTALEYCSGRPVIAIAPLTSSDCLISFEDTDSKFLKLNLLICEPEHDRIKTEKMYKFILNCFRNSYPV